MLFTCGYGYVAARVLGEQWVQRREAVVLGDVGSPANVDSGIAKAA